MLSRFQFLTFILLISAPQILCGRSKESTTLEAEINRLESGLTKDQQEFKMETKKIIQETGTTLNLLVDDVTFKVLVETLMIIRNFSMKLIDITDVSPTQLEDTNSSDCDLVKSVIKIVEKNVENYLSIIRITNSIKIDLFYAKEELNSEYFLNYMLMNESQDASIVKLTGSVEKFLKLIDFFVSNFQTNSLHIANYLFKLKIKKAKRCRNIIEDDTAVEIIKNYTNSQRKAL